MMGPKKLVLRLVKNLLLSFYYPRLYKTACSQTSVDPKKALFVDYRSASIPESMLLIHEELEKRGYLTKYIGLERDSVSEREFIHRCAVLVEEMAECGVVFLSDANEIVSCVPKRPETKVIQLWHGCGAFKKFGLSTVSNRFGNEEREMQKHPYYGNLDLVTVSSPQVVPNYEEAMGLTGEECKGIVQPIGVSRADVFFNKARVKVSGELIRRSFPQIGNRKIVLYAPTFRGRPSRAKAPELPDLEYLREQLSDDIFLLIRQHPFVKQPVSLPGTLSPSFCVEAAGDFRIETLMMASDLCITDYSSLVFEYSLLERPILFYAVDLEEYNDWRGFYYPYETMTPGPVSRNSQQLAEDIRSALTSFDFERIRTFREEFMSACDGRSTQRILEWLEQSERS